VAVTRPQNTAEIRDIEDSVSAAEVAAALAEKGGCQTGEVFVGPIRRWAVNGLGTAWVRCPLAAANKLAREGAVRIGWTRSRVEVLPERALRCYKCWDMGHVRAACPSEIDRTAACYRCGVQGHQARGCDAPVNCALCAESNRPSNHRAGGPACKAPKPRRRKNKGATPAPKSASTAPAPPEGGGTPMEVNEEAAAAPGPLPKRAIKRPRREEPAATSGGTGRGVAIPLPPLPPTPPTERNNMEAETKAPSRGASAPTAPPVEEEEPIEGASRPAGVDSGADTEPLDGE